MDVISLSRMQFGLTAMLHVLFPPVTIGLSLLVAVTEGLRLRTGRDVYRRASDFWIGILAVSVAAKVATGALVALGLGTSWGDLPRRVTGATGPLLATGATFLALELGLLSALALSRPTKASPARSVAAAALCVATTLSGCWLVAVSSFMQTPAGYAARDGRLVITSLPDAALNPSFLPRALHTITSSWAVAAFLVAGCSAWWTLRGQRSDVARYSLRVGTTGALVASAAVFLTGDRHARQVAHTQPAKFAAMQGLRSTAAGAPLIVFSLPPTQEGSSVGPQVAVTHLTSFLAFGNFQAPVKGLDEFPPADWPPVAPTFLAFHNMVILGNAMLLVALVSVVLLVRKRLDWARGWLWTIVIATPLPILAVELGWIAAEVGRQPWIVYGVVRTADAVSPVATPALARIALVLYAGLAVATTAVWLTAVAKRVRQGPEPPPGSSPSSHRGSAPEELLHA